VNSKKDDLEAGSMAQVVEHLPSKYKALNLSPSTTPKKDNYGTSINDNLSQYERP
jgi:hypothetical protein